MPHFETLDYQFTGPDTFDRIIHKLARTDYAARFLASQYQPGNISALASQVGPETLGAAVANANRRIADVSGRREVVLTGDGLVWSGGFSARKVFTLAMRIKFSAAPPANRNVLDGGAPFTLRRLTDGKLYAWINGAAASGGVTAAPTNGAWQTLVIVRDGANSILSLDGAESAFDGGAAALDHLYVGVNGQDTFSWREAVLYNTPLDFTDRQALRTSLLSAKA